MTPSVHSCANVFFLNPDFTGTSVVTVKAFAPVSSPDAIRYSVVSGNEDGVFSLGSNSGNPFLPYDGFIFCSLHWHYLLISHSGTFLRIRAEEGRERTQEPKAGEEGGETVL